MSCQIWQMQIFHVLSAAVLNNIREIICLNTSFCFQPRRSVFLPPTPKEWDLQPAKCSVTFSVSPVKVVPIKYWWDWSHSCGTKSTLNVHQRKPSCSQRVDVSSLAIKHIFDAKSKSLLLQTNWVGLYAESKYQGSGKGSDVMFPCLSCCQTSPLFLSHPTATETLRETECHHH